MYKKQNLLWTLQQTLTGVPSSYFGIVVAYSPSSTQLAVGANGITGMYRLEDRDESLHRFIDDAEKRAMNK